MCGQHTQPPKNDNGGTLKVNNTITEFRQMVKDKSLMRYSWKFKEMLIKFIEEKKTTTCLTVKKFLPKRN